MRLLIVGIAACLVPINLFASRPAYGNRPAVRFAEHTIATDLRGGYQVVVADINHDGKPDLIALASGLKELAWYKNPGWRKHVLVSGISAPINCAVFDID